MRQWLDDLGQSEATMRVDGHVLRIERHRVPAAHRVMHHDFIG